MSQFDLSTWQSHCTDVDGVDVVVGRGGLPEIHVANRFCKAEISLLGGQVLTFKRVADEYALLFCSENAFFQLGKGIKGGAPVCWPWFGDDPEGRGAHGFARSSLWDIEAVNSDECGVTQIDLFLPQEVFSAHPEWPYASALKTSIRLGKWLSISLETTNLSDRDMPLTQALHTYFKVGDCREVSVVGLENASYLDKVVDFARLPASGDAITFAAEVDRIYDNNVGEITLIDKSLGRTITIRSEGSGSAIVWNPWLEKAKAMADFAEHEYLDMVCVETANAGGDGRLLEAGEKHALTVIYKF